MEPISGIHFTYILVGFLEVRFQRLPSSSPLMTSQLCYTLLRRCGEHEHHTLVNDKKNHARSQGPSLRGSTHEGGARAVPDRRQITAKKSKREASCKLQEGDDDDSLSLSLSLSLSPISKATVTGEEHRGGRRRAGTRQRGRDERVRRMRTRADRKSQIRQ